MNLEGVLFVVFVTMLILFIASTYYAIYIAVIYQYNKLLFYLISIPFSLIFTLLVTSYFRAVCTSPGHPSKSLSHNYSLSQIQQLKQLSQEHKNHNRQRRKKARLTADPQQLLQMQQTTYCSTCQVVKIPRVHHCSVCSDCIQRMDHHCPWVGNCIGQQNHKYFILFLFYATVGLTIVWATVAADGFKDWQYVSKVQSDVATAMICVAGILSFILSLSIGGLLVSQILGAVRNVTTLQSFVPGIQDKSPFDTGDWKVNLQQIMGKDNWLLPVNPDLEDDKFLSVKNSINAIFSLDVPPENTISHNK